MFTSSLLFPHFPSPLFGHLPHPYHPGPLHPVPPLFTFPLPTPKPLSSHPLPKPHRPSTQPTNTPTDLQHNIWRLNLHNALYLSPLPPSPKTILEIGTGTGIWALEFAEKFPQTQVTGIDLSLIHPPSPPPNVNFMIANAEDPWTFAPGTKYDFIHARMLCMAIRGWPRLFHQAFAHLQPGGWLECQEVSFPLRSDVPGEAEASAYLNWTCRIMEAMSGRGVDLKAAERFAEMLKGEGFVNVGVKQLRWPVGEWTEEGGVKGVGELFLQDMERSMEMIGYGILMKHFGQTREEVESELRAVGEDARDETKRYYGTS